MPKNKGSKNKVKKPGGRKLAQQLGMEHDMWWVYHGQDFLVHSSPQGLQEACANHIAELGRARPWQPLGDLREQKYPTVGTFDKRKKHGAQWMTVLGSGGVGFFCINMEHDIPTIDQFHGAIRDHPWTAKNQVGKVFTFKQNNKTTGEGALSDHESPYNVVFMTTWGDTWEGSVTKHNDVTKATDTGMRHIWMRTNMSTTDGRRGFKTRAMCNMLCHIGHFTPLYEEGPGGNYGTSTGESPSQPRGMPMATQGRAASNSTQIISEPKPTRQILDEPEATTVEQNEAQPGVYHSPLHLGTPVADEALPPTSMGLPMKPFTAPSPGDSCMSSSVCTPRGRTTLGMCMPMAAPEGNIEASHEADGPGQLTELDIESIDSGDSEDSEDAESQTEMEGSEGEDSKTGSAWELGAAAALDLRPSVVFCSTPTGTDAGSVLFDSLPNQGSMSGLAANIRFYNGHAVSNDQDIREWMEMEEAGNDAGPHKFVVYGESGDPENPLSFHRLGPAGMYEPIPMVPGTTMDGGMGHFYHLPSDFPDFPADCQVIPGQVDALLQALGARGHNDTVTSYFIILNFVFFFDNCSLDQVWVLVNEVDGSKFGARGNWFLWFSLAVLATLSLPTAPSINLHLF